MIPPLMVFGLLFGRWPGACLVAAAVTWPAALVATGALDLGTAIGAAAVLAVANTLVGVVANRGAAALLARARPSVVSR